MTAAAVKMGDKAVSPAPQLPQPYSTVEGEACTSLNQTGVDIVSLHLPGLSDCRSFISRIPVVAKD